MSELGKHVQVSADSFRSLNSHCLGRNLAKRQRTRAEMRAHLPLLEGQCHGIWEQRCNGCGRAGGAGETTDAGVRSTSGACGWVANSSVKPQHQRKYTWLPARRLPSHRGLLVAPWSILKITDGTEKERESQRPGFCSGLSH